MGSIIAEPDESESIILRRISAAVSANLRGALHGSGISVDEWHVLDQLARCSYATMTGLAIQIAVSGPTLTRIVDGLASRSLVERLADTHDRRRILVHVRPAGRMLRESLLTQIRLAEEAALASVGRQQLVQLAGQMLHLVNSTSESLESEVAC